MKDSMSVLKAEPIYDRTIWAGNRLAKLRGRPDRKEGTSWEISIHPYAQSVVSEGRFKGRTLASLVEENPEGMLGKGFGEEELLRIAWLDAGEALSVQVHPGETYAMCHEKDHGKTESWYILEAEEGAELVAGSRFSSRDEILEAIEKDTIEAGLIRIPVQAGDFVLVPSGTLHALGKGILAVEIGTNSNTTYRFYDYHRRDAEGKERQLHIEKSLDVVRFDQRGTCVHSPLDHVEKIRRIADFAEYSVDLYDIEGEYTLKAHPESFRTVTCVNGDFTVKENSETIALEYLRSAFISADSPDLVLKGHGRILVGTPRKRPRMEITEPPYTADFSSVREDAVLETGTKRLKDISGKFYDVSGMDPETVLYRVTCDNGDPAVPTSLSFGVTEIEPVLVNGECAFTKGHWHTNEEAEEIYEGDAGEGLLMYMDHQGNCWCEKVFPGSIHHIRGSYAHRLINTGDTLFRVRCTWPPCAGHNYAAVDAMPFAFRVFKTEGRIRVVPYEQL